MISTLSHFAFHLSIAGHEEKELLFVNKVFIPDLCTENHHIPL